MSYQNLDTRDLQKRLDELEEYEQEYQEALVEYESSDDHDDELSAKLSNAERNFDKHDEEELRELRLLEKEIREWVYGETLIHSDNFVDYVQDLCEDCGYISKDFPYWIVVDWEATAKNLEVDYIEVEYQGEKYLVENC